MRPAFYDVQKKHTKKAAYPRFRFKIGRIFFVNRSASCGRDGEQTNASFQRRSVLQRWRDGSRLLITFPLQDSGDAQTRPISKYLEQALISGALSRLRIIRHASFLSDFILRFSVNPGKFAVKTTRLS